MDTRPQYADCAVELDPSSANMVLAPVTRHSLVSAQTAAEPDPKLPFAGLYAYAYGHHERQLWQGAWDAAVEHWLTSGRRRSNATRRAYRFAVNQFRQFLREQHAIDHLWQITAYHVQDWMNHMAQQQGMGKRTVALRVAACSSFYDYCGGATGMLAGQEVALFIDAHGATRGNPFKAAQVARPKITQYDDAKAIPSAVFRWIIDDLRQQLADRAGGAPTPTYRNLALLLMFGFSGWRTAEVLSLTWGQLQEHRQQQGQATNKETSKTRTGAGERRVLPAICYDAIVTYLKADDHRERTIAPADYVWQPLRTHQCANFVNTTEELAAGAGGNRHITQSTANGILRSQLFRYYKHYARTTAGMAPAAARSWAQEQAQQYHVHSIRHMFAWELYHGAGRNVELVSKQLGHKSVATTQSCLRHMQEPAADYGALLARQLGLNV